MQFLHDDFFLTTDTARRLYHEAAANQPIYDYHCHLSPADIAGNRVFDNLHDIWLEGDHYKWRAMRANGIDEHLITGDADPYDKFRAWARTVPKTLRNPLYHWTHLELRRYFGIDALLNEHTAQDIWDEANKQLGNLSTHAIFGKFNVAAVCTTDDPADSLEHHHAIAKLGLNTQVYPTFRPDKALAVPTTDAQRAYRDRLFGMHDVRGRALDDLIEALDKSLQRFADAGCRLSDHGLGALPAGDCPHSRAASIYHNTDVWDDGQPTVHDQDRLTAYLMQHLGERYADRGWTMQLHLGAIRNVNTGLYNQLGPDVGCDSIGDAPQSPGLQRLLGNLAGEGKLPQTVLYNLNPADNALFASMAGNFNQGPTPGKVQYGSGWWFLDQKHGIIEQLNALSNLGLLSRFVGMLTDSRSMMSYPRHEYFRRILCGLLGEEAQRGELPDDFGLLSQLVRDICFNNARDYFGLGLSPRYAE
ncbi:MAG: glucuronate isomerase [Phycisphaerales bacterium JB063]